jgi:hypothetical protein
MKRAGLITLYEWQMLLGCKATALSHVGTFSCHNQASLARLQLYVYPHTMPNTGTCLARALAHTANNVTLLTFAYTPRGHDCLY